jgi:hypothetical protein
MSEFAFNRKRFYLIPLFFIIHNMEEILLFKRTNVYYELTGIDFTAFSVAVLLISAIVVFAFRFSEIYKNGHYFYYIAIGLLTGMVLNALTAHLIGSIYFKTLMPGLISSLVLILPLACYIFIKDLKSVIKRKNIILSMIIIPIVMLALTAGLLYSSNYIFNDIIYPDNYKVNSIN